MFPVVGYLPGGSALELASSANVRSSLTIKGKACVVLGFRGLQHLGTAARRAGSSLVTWTSQQDVQHLPHRNCRCGSLPSG